MKVAYIGPAQGTSLQRARALERLGHEVAIVDPWSWLGQSKWMSRWLYHLGGLGVGVLVDRRIDREVSRVKPDLIWVDQGPFLGPNCLRKLRNIGVPIINYAIDDPFGPGNEMRFYYYRRAVPYYDLLVVVRKENATEAKHFGARRVMLVWRSADEIAHKPRVLTKDKWEQYTSEVAFIGTWMPERGPFMAELVSHGVPLSIWGDRWQKASEWPLLKSFWRGPGVYDDRDYSACILAAKICLGLLSKGNRDLHTSRSMEIPALGGLLCAERTEEHRTLYEEGIEAVFWDDAVECAEICKDLLADEARRRGIAIKGHERTKCNNYFNEPILAAIIDVAMGQK